MKRRAATYLCFTASAAAKAGFLELGLAVMGCVGCRVMQYRRGARHGDSLYLSLMSTTLYRASGRVEEKRCRLSLPFLCLATRDSADGSKGEEDPFPLCAGQILLWLG